MNKPLKEIEELFRKQKLNHTLVSLHNFYNLKTSIGTQLASVVDRIMVLNNVKCMTMVFIKFKSFSNSLILENKKKILEEKRLKLNDYIVERERIADNVKETLDLEISVYQRVEAGYKEELDELELKYGMLKQEFKKYADNLDEWEVNNHEKYKKVVTYFVNRTDPIKERHIQVVELLEQLGNKLAEQIKERASLNHEKVDKFEFEYNKEVVSISHLEQVNKKFIERISHDCIDEANKAFSINEELYHKITKYLKTINENNLLIEKDIVIAKACKEALTTHEPVFNQIYNKYNEKLTFKKLVQDEKLTFKKLVQDEKRKASKMSILQDGFDINEISKTVNDQISKQCIKNKLIKKKEETFSYPLYDIDFKIDEIKEMFFSGVNETNDLNNLDSIHDSTVSHFSYVCNDVKLFEDVDPNLTLIFDEFEGDNLIKLPTDPLDGYNSEGTFNVLNHKRGR